MMLDGKKGVKLILWKSIPMTFPFLFIAGPPIAVNVFINVALSISWQILGRSAQRSTLVIKKGIRKIDCFNDNVFNLIYSSRLYIKKILVIILPTHQFVYYFVCNSCFLSLAYILHSYFTRYIQGENYSSNRPKLVLPFCLQFSMFL